MDVLRPETPQELAALLYRHSVSGQAVQLGGAFSKDRQGGPLAANAQRISTSRLNRVLVYEPNDLTISVEAGLPWNDLTAILAQNGQALTLDPPYSAQATVGGVVAANLCGPRRRSCGSARDLVIGMTYATTAGTLVKSGGMVVKNVAGLDLAKLMIGSLGTLAGITSVNFRVSPAATGTRTFVLGGRALPDLFLQRSRMLSGVLQPSAIDIVNAELATRLGLPGAPHLLVQATGSTRVLTRFEQELAGYRVVDGMLWSRVREWMPEWLAQTPGGAIVRVSTSLTDQSGLLAEASGPALARAGSGVAYAGFARPEQVQRWTRSGAVVEFRPLEENPQLELWPQPGDALELMVKVKSLYDPRRILNPGRFYGRL
jgi:glycolate oxidase FAD binding subunit